MAAEVVKSVAVQMRSSTRVKLQLLSSTPYICKISGMNLIGFAVLTYFKKIT